MVQPAHQQRMTVGEFLTANDGTSTRYELVGGELVAMNPPAESHVRLTANIYDGLLRRLARPCRPYFGGGVWLSEADDTWREPDIFVSCAEGEGFSHLPRLIVEVLSPSTEAEDRGVKLPNYRRLASVQDILLVASERVAVEHYARQGEQWLIVARGPGETVRLVGLPVELAVDALYADLGLDEAAVAS